MKRLIARMLIEIGVFGRDKFFADDGLKVFELTGGEGRDGGHERNPFIGNCDASTSLSRVILGTDSSSTDKKTDKRMWAANPFIRLASVRLYRE
jgi:hypothetical protein